MEYHVAACILHCGQRSTEGHYTTRRHLSLQVTEPSSKGFGTVRCGGCREGEPSRYRIKRGKPKQKPCPTVSDSIASRALTFDMRISVEQHVLDLADLRDLISVLTCWFFILEETEKSEPVQGVSEFSNTIVHRARGSSFG